MHSVRLFGFLERLAGEPNWIVVTVVGALAGASVAPLVTVVWYAAKRLRPHPLCATWFSYHMTFRDSRPVMLSGVYRITRGFRSSLLIRAENLADDDVGQPRKTLFYRGTMEQEGGHYIMDLSGHPHKERLIIRFAERIPPNDSMLSGIWLAYDHDNQVAAGAQLFSRRRLAPEEAAAALRSWVSISPGAIRLRGVPRQRSAATQGGQAAVEAPPTPPVPGAGATDL